MDSLYPLIAHDAQHELTIRLYTPQTGVEWRPLAELMYVEGQCSYSWLYWSDASKSLMPYTIKRFVEKLPAPNFGRVHRKFMINYRFVEAWDFRVKACSVVLSTGVRLSVSRRYRAIFRSKAMVSSKPFLALCTVGKTNS